MFKTQLCLLCSRRGTWMLESSQLGWGIAVYPGFCIPDLIQLGSIFSLQSPSKQTWFKGEGLGLKVKRGSSKSTSPAPTSSFPHLLRSLEPDFSFRSLHWDRQQMATPESGRNQWQWVSKNVDMVKREMSQRSRGLSKCKIHNSVEKSNFL